ncbi:MAG: peptide deformylase [Dehalococcoidia bacterium]|nr:peptide deformylase [Dehalococcoidia bacterium]
MAVIPIRTVPDPVLRQKAKRVKNVDSAIQKLIADMRETVVAASGVGLAAPQVGVSLRVIVLCVPKKDEKNEEYCLINPEIVRRKGERVLKEGCLSIPGYIGEIKRSEQVRVRGTDETGKEIKLRCEGLLAQAIEHEIDHLNGVLYVDHLESQDKLQKVEPEKQEPEESIQ